jgi:hypothetical protein
VKKKQSLKTLKTKCWKLFSEWVRRKDADEGGSERCYTCSRPFHWKELQCGHAIGGRHNAVLLDADICRPQCVHCNVFSRGNYPIFTAKLIREHGLEWFEEKLAGSRQVKKYTRIDLEALIESYKTKIQELEEKERDGLAQAA